MIQIAIGRDDFLGYVINLLLAVNSSHLHALSLYRFQKMRLVVICIIHANAIDESAGAAGETIWFHVDDLSEYAL